MTARFVGNIALGLAGAFMVAASLGFSSNVTGWLMFGVALGIVALAGAAQLDSRRGLAQRVLDGVAATLALWSVVASVVFAGAVLTWLSFAEAAGLVGLAVAGLAAEELQRHEALRTAQGSQVEAGRAAAEELRAVA
jgi:asparagine N-glycosylation enzyme membrane subunit Stt3